MEFLLVFYGAQFGNHYSKAMNGIRHLHKPSILIKKWFDFKSIYIFYAIIMMRILPKQKKKKKEAMNVLQCKHALNRF